jgi:hypothetical protein
MLGRLIASAVKANPNNPQLRAVAAAYKDQA